MDNIPVEAWKCLGSQGTAFLTRLFNEILQNEERVAEKYIRLVRDMYRDCETVIRCAV